MKEERRALIDYRLEQADESLDLCSNNRTDVPKVPEAVERQSQFVTTSV